METSAIGLLFLGKFLIILLIIKIIRKKNKIKEEKSLQAIERMQIREYGRKVNEKTRSKKIINT